MRRLLLPSAAVLTLLANPAFAGGVPPTPMPLPGILGLAVAAVVAAVYLTRRKR